MVITRRMLQALEGREEEGGERGREDTESIDLDSDSEYFEDDEEESGSETRSYLDEWELARSETDWPLSKFHDSIVNNYFVKHLSLEWIYFIKDSISEYNTDDYRQYADQFLSIETLPSQIVHTCQVCNQIRTLSKIISFNSTERYYCGRNCAKKIQGVTNFYINMLGFPLQNHSNLSSILSSLEENFSF